MSNKLTNVWEKTLDDGSAFVVSTTRSLLDISFINDVFASDDLYWAERMKTDDLKLMLDNSLTFGLYVKKPDSKPDASGPGIIREEQDLEQIGLARLITDRTTFAYLTDVYVADRYRSLGLGRWLIACLQEAVDDMPNLRRIMLLTSGGVDKSTEGNIGTKIRFYEETLGMSVFTGKKGLVCMGRKGKAHAKMVE